GQMRLLAGCVKGWPSPDCDAPQTQEGAAESFISKMVASGMLTTDLGRGKEAQPLRMPRPETTLTAVDLKAPNPFDARPAIALREVLRFFGASVRARAALRWRPIASVVARAMARKARRASRGLDLATARKHVAAFIHLRPLLFTTKDACLADSLALVN